MYNIVGYDYRTDSEAKKEVIEYDILTLEEAETVRDMYMNIYDEIFIEQVL